MHGCAVNGLKIGDGAPVRSMGVINCSPESFFRGSYFAGHDIRMRALEMGEHGADIIDIGARSTAPMSRDISVACERDRMAGALEELEGSGLTISVDTMRPEVLTTALRYDIHAINDISGLVNPEFAKIAADSGLPCFLMATKATPGDSQDLQATFAALGEVVSRCEAHSIENYVLDPAIGKWHPDRSTSLDWEICRHFDELACFNHPLLAAISRKTFLGDLLSENDPADRLAGSLALTVLLLKKGADIVRCHDVKETADILLVFEKMENRG